VSTPAATIGLTLAAAFLLSSTLAAQQNLEQSRATALREAERYINCWTRNDVGCIEEMTHRESLEAAGMLSREMNRLRALMDSRTWFFPDQEIYNWLEAAPAWPPFSVDGVVYAFVPTLETWTDPVNTWTDRGGRSRRTDRMAYLLGASEDDGESWRFIQVDEESVLSSHEIDRVIPGYDGPQPEIRVVVADARPIVRSRWLLTQQRGFSPVDDAYAYTLKLDVRRDVDEPIDFTVSYEDPADASGPAEFRGTLAPGQRELEWQSPALRGFEFGANYEVVIEGRYPDSSEVIFEHRETLLFQPTRELWLSVMSRPPLEPTVQAN
jgi:hypothetical protein